jgi:hypothetical protein
MGSFSEVVLGFSFREDTPDEVLAAVSALERPSLEPAPWREPVPAPPEPVNEPVDWWCPDWRDMGGGEQDPLEQQPWRHDWAPWLSGSMMSGIEPSAALVWTGWHWNLTCRCAFKAGAESVYVALEWFGRFIEGRDPDLPLLVGYIDDEQKPRPYLLWTNDGRLVMEDLNAGGGGPIS